MSTDREVILEALADAPLTSAEVVEATGFEQKLVSNRLYALKAAGLLTLAEGRYSVVGAAPAKAVRAVAAREAEADEPKPAKRGRKPKAAKASPPPAAVSANGRCCEFAIAESGAILFKVVSGPRAGELGEIGCADALALFRLMGAVEFITENA